jgi:hypothetical protein
MGRTTVSVVPRLRFVERCDLVELRCYERYARCDFVDAAL